MEGNQNQVSEAVKTGDVAISVESFKTEEGRQGILKEISNQVTALREMREAKGYTNQQLQEFMVVGRLQAVYRVWKSGTELKEFLEKSNPTEVSSEAAEKGKNALDYFLRQVEKAKEELQALPPAVEEAGEKTESTEAGQSSPVAREEVEDFGKGGETEKEVGEGAELPVEENKETATATPFQVDDYVLVTVNGRELPGRVTKIDSQSKEAVVIVSGPGGFSPVRESFEGLRVMPTFQEDDLVNWFDPHQGEYREARVLRVIEEEKEPPIVTIEFSVDGQPTTKTVPVMELKRPTEVKPEVPTEAQERAAAPKEEVESIEESEEAIDKLTAEGPLRLGDHVKATVEGTVVYGRLTDLDEDKSEVAILSSESQGKHVRVIRAPLSSVERFDPIKEAKKALELRKQEINEINRAVQVGKKVADADSRVRLLEGQIHAIEDVLRMSTTGRISNSQEQPKSTGSPKKEETEPPVVPNQEPVTKSEPELVEVDTANLATESANEPSTKNRESRKPPEAPPAPYSYNLSAVNKTWEKELFRAWQEADYEARRVGLALMSIFKRLKRKS